MNSAALTINPINATNPSINGVKIAFINPSKIELNSPIASDILSDAASISLNLLTNATINAVRTARTAIIGFAFNIFNAALNLPAPSAALPAAGEIAPICSFKFLK